MSINTARGKQVQEFCNVIQDDDGQEVCGKPINPNRPPFFVDPAQQFKACDECAIASVSRQNDACWNDIDHVLTEVVEVSPGFDRNSFNQDVMRLMDNIGGEPTDDKGQRVPSYLEENKFQLAIIVAKDLRARINLDVITTWLDLAQTKVDAFGSSGFAIVVNTTIVDIRRRRDEMAKLTGSEGFRTKRNESHRLLAEAKDAFAAASDLEAVRGNLENFAEIIDEIKTMSDPYKESVDGQAVLTELSKLEENHRQVITNPSSAVNMVKFSMHQLSLANGLLNKARGLEGASARRSMVKELYSGRSSWAARFGAPTSSGNSNPTLGDSVDANTKAALEEMASQDDEPSEVPTVLSNTDSESTAASDEQASSDDTVDAPAATVDNA